MQSIRPASANELLIIQKEFTGFDTNERPDLLALDKKGALVLIENKLDDSGKDVTWQALKYASYCSSLKTDNVVKIFQEYLEDSGNPGKCARTLIAAFVDKDDPDEQARSHKENTQRIILIAANFRKEVTSTVLWAAQCLRWISDASRSLRF